MRFFLTATCLLLCTASASFAADVYVPAQQPQPAMQLSEAVRYPAQPYYAAPAYVAPQQVMAQPQAAEGNQSQKNDIMWMNNF